MQKLTDVLESHDSKKYTVVVEVTIEVDAYSEGDAGYTADSIAEAIPGYVVHHVVDINDGGIEHETESFKQLANKNFGHQVGKNADWSGEVWHLGEGAPNKSEGDRYLVLDETAGTASIVARYYGRSGDSDLLETLFVGSPLEALDEAVKMKGV